MRWEGTAEAAVCRWRPGLGGERRGELGVGNGAERWRWGVISRPHFVTLQPTHASLWLPGDTVSSFISNDIRLQRRAPRSLQVAEPGCCRSRGRGVCHGAGWGQRRRAEAQGRTLHSAK